MPSTAQKGTSSGARVVCFRQVLAANSIVTGRNKPTAIRRGGLGYKLSPSDWWVTSGITLLRLSFQPCQIGLEDLNRLCDSDPHFLRNMFEALPNTLGKLQLCRVLFDRFPVNFLLFAFHLRLTPSLSLP